MEEILPDQRMKAYIAKWIVPVSSPPIENGVIIIDAGKIVDIGDRNLLNLYSVEVQDLGEVVVFPGFVNCHVHLEHPYMREKPQSFRRYQQQLLQFRYQRSLEKDEENINNNLHYIDEGGIVALADFSLEGASYKILTERKTYARVFLEIRGFQGFSANEILKKYLALIQDNNGEKTVTKHLAPTSIWEVAPEIFRVVSLNERHISMHLNCDPAEEEFTRFGTGFLRQILLAEEEFDYGWKVPVCSPVEYFFSNHFYAKHNLLVHMTETTQSEMDFMRNFGVKVNICVCPRAELQLSDYLPPVQLFMEKGYNICIGTEGRILVDNFNIKEEMLVLSEKLKIAPENIVKFATLNGAYAIGFHKEVGSLEPGKSSRCLVLEIDDNYKDPYEAIIYSKRGINWLPDNGS